MKTKFLPSIKSLLNTSFVIVMLLLMTVTIQSCSSEDSGSSVNCEEQLLELAETMNQNSMTFSENPTKANCEKLKASALKLIEKAKKCGYEEQWAAVTASWEEIDCSELD